MTRYRTIIRVLTCMAVGILIPQASPGQDDGQAAARALLSRAIEAVGGVKNLSNFQVLTARVQGAFVYPDDKNLAIKFRSSVQGHDRIRLEMDSFQTVP